MAIQTVNPATNKVEKVFEEMMSGDVDKAVEIAAGTFNDWKQTDFKTRAAVLHKVAGILRERKTMLAKMITTEMGKLVAGRRGY